MADAAQHGDDDASTTSTPGHTDGVAMDSNKETESELEGEQVATLRQVIEQKDQELAAKDQVIEQKDEELTANRKELTAKDKELTANRQELAAHQEEIALLKAQLQKLQQPKEGVPPV